METKEIVLQVLENLIKGFNTEELRAQDLNLEVSTEPKDGMSFGKINLIFATTKGETYISELLGKGVEMADPIEVDNATELEVVDITSEDVKDDG